MDVASPIKDDLRLRRSGPGGGGHVAPLVPSGSASDVAEAKKERERCVCLGESVRNECLKSWRHGVARDSTNWVTIWAPVRSNPARTCSIIFRLLARERKRRSRLRQRQGRGGGLAGGGGGDVDMGDDGARGDRMQAGDGMGAAAAMFASPSQPPPYSLRNAKSAGV